MIQMKKTGLFAAIFFFMVIFSRWFIVCSEKQFAEGIPVWGYFKPLFELLRFLGQPAVTFPTSHPLTFSLSLTFLIIVIWALLSFRTFQEHKKSTTLSALCVIFFVWARFLPGTFEFHNQVQYIFLLCAALSSLAVMVTPSSEKKSYGHEDSLIAYRCHFSWCLVAILLIGFMFRVYRIDILPPGHAQHTAQWGMMGARQAATNPVTLLNESGRRFFFDQLKTRLALEPHQQGFNIFVDWLLADWFKPSLIVQRTSTALLGVLSILALYWVAGLYFGQRVALMSAFFCAISPWHITHSRYSSMEHILAFMLVVLSMGFLAQYLRRKSILWLILLMSVLIADFYVYVIAQVIVPVVFVSWIYFILRDKCHRIKSFIPVVILIVFVSIGIAPKTGIYGMKDRVKWLNTQVEEHPDYRLQKGDVILKNAVMIARALFLDAEGGAWFQKKTGYLIWPVSLLLMAGLGLSLKSTRSPWFLSIVIWFLIGIFPTLPSSIVAPRRILCALPAIYILAGIGGNLLWMYVSSLFSKQKLMMTAAVGIFGLMGASGAWVAFESNSLSPEDYSNGMERRLAEVACQYMDSHTVYLCFDPHTRLEKIWMICGDLGPETPSVNAVVFLNLMNHDESISRLTDFMVNSRQRGFVVLLPLSSDADTLMGYLKENYSFGKPKTYGFDPYFRNHDAGQPAFQAWIVDGQQFAD